MKKWKILASNNTFFCHKAYSKMVSMATLFLCENLKILYISDHSILFIFHKHVVQVYGESLAFQYQHQLVSDWKINSCSKCAIKPLQSLQCYRFECWYWKSKVFPSIIWTCEVWTKSYGPKYSKVLTNKNKTCTKAKTKAKTKIKRFSKTILTILQLMKWLFNNRPYDWMFHF